ncbi:Nicotinate-nucleotide adenylyltransferase [Lentibacillus sp. JNUCC-1]|uniref:bis(5'-nucleosyl)-tetraphosphatase (symmetrical) YqeK n=1 Tax=Lentibacillus sp. JNUCC-1 TaxID=2654513 RepID=UPI0012E84061|nr:bis(5'-nucleosyl)-tetraphosphatase (symmetrical) YqeK [Lentibacillus sp. JNUCC-1]MUV39568.1 Nicotinate-nucleotide adenylyltransferase [Lentibacillus sp. JNUCC-1]
MNRNDAINIVKPVLTEVRYEHTLRVADTAVMLAEAHQGSIRQAELAGLLHDYAKYHSKQEMVRWIKSTTLPKDLLDYHHELWHAPVGAKMLRLIHGVTDRAVLDAIYYHTTGRAHMTQLDMIVFVADYTEPGRDFPGVDQVREASRNDLVYASWLALKNTVIYLAGNESGIYPDTLHAYNDLTKYVKGGQ